MFLTPERGGFSGSVESETDTTTAELEPALQIPIKPLQRAPVGQLVERVGDLLTADVDPRGLAEDHYEGERHTAVVVPADGLPLLAVEVDDWVVEGIDLGESVSQSIVNEVVARGAELLIRHAIGLLFETLLLLVAGPLTDSRTALGTVVGVEGRICAPVIAVGSEGRGAVALSDGLRVMGSPDIGLEHLHPLPLGIVDDRFRSGVGVGVHVDKIIHANILHSNIVVVSNHVGSLDRSRV